MSTILTLGGAVLWSVAREEANATEMQESAAARGLRGGNGRKRSEQVYR